MPYYVESGTFWLLPIESEHVLIAALPKLDPRFGARFLYLDVRAHSLSIAEPHGQSPWLRAYLEGFPRERVPGLERRFACTSLNAVLEIREAWLVTLHP